MRASYLPPPQRPQPWAVTGRARQVGEAVKKRKGRAECGALQGPVVVMVGLSDLHLSGGHVPQLLHQSSYPDSQMLYGLKT